MSVAISFPPRTRIASKRAKSARQAPFAGLLKGSYVAILTDGSRIPVSRGGHVRLKALLGEEDGKA